MAEAKDKAAEPEAPAARGQIRVTALVNLDELRAGDTKIVDDNDEWRARAEKGLVVLT